MTCEPGPFPPPPVPSELIAEIRQMLRASIGLVEIATETERKADKAEAKGQPSTVIRRRADALWGQVKDVDILIVDRLEKAETIGLLAQWQAHLAQIEGEKA